MIRHPRMIFQEIISGCFTIRGKKFLNRKGAEITPEADSPFGERKDF